MKYVALLRGINVGGNNIVSMAGLKRLFEELGFLDVVTYINSGNIIFTTNNADPDKLSKKIESGIEKRLKMKLRVVVRDSDTIQKLTSKIPSEWVNDAEQKTDILFLWPEFDTKETLAKISINEAVDTLLYIPGAIVWHLKKKDYKKSKMKNFIDTPVYKQMTARNINTVRKLAEMMKQGILFPYNLDLYPIWSFKK